MAGCSSTQSPPRLRRANTFDPAGVRWRREPLVDITNAFAARDAAARRVQQEQQQEHLGLRRQVSDDEEEVNGDSWAPANLRRSPRIRRQRTVGASAALAVGASAAPPVWFSPQRAGAVERRARPLDPSSAASTSSAGGASTSRAPAAVAGASPLSTRHRSGARVLSLMLDAAAPSPPPSLQRAGRVATADDSPSIIQDEVLALDESLLAHNDAAGGGQAVGERVVARRRRQRRRLDSDGDMLDMNRSDVETTDDEQDVLSVDVSPLHRARSADRFAGTSAAATATTSSSSASRALRRSRTSANSHRNLR